MDAEQIVRALASDRAPVEIDAPTGLEDCLLCHPMHRWEPADARRQPLLRVVKEADLEGPVMHLEETEDIIEAHEPGCPWRLAREWVATDPG